MTRIPKKLLEKLVRRKAQNTLRHLPEANDLVDFSSNDYLGLSRNRDIFERASQLLSAKNSRQNGATGSRLLSGNHPLYSELEEILSEFHQTESALIFNSGYDANIGFFGAVPQRGDIVFYDELIHASIRDGIKMGNAKSYKFRHNDVEDLKKKCRTAVHRSAAADPIKVASNNSTAGAEGQAEVRSPSVAEVYVVTESVFSMDGDSPNLKALVEFCQENNYHLIVDEAHAVGVYGKNGEGLVQELELQEAIFARIVTFGKAMGCHGAAILGSTSLKNYLVNFARSLIYTTGLPPHAVATVIASYEYLTSCENADNSTKRNIPILDLKRKIELFNLELAGLKPTSPAGRLKPFFIPSTSAIHCCILSGNEQVRAVEEKLRENGFDVKAILPPTVPQEQERLRICLHSFNTKGEIHKLLEILSLCIQTQ